MNDPLVKINGNMYISHKGCFYQKWKSLLIRAACDHKFFGKYAVSENDRGRSEAPKSVSGMYKWNHDYETVDSFVNVIYCCRSIIFRKNWKKN